MCFSIQVIYDPWFQALLLAIYLMAYYGLHSLLAGRRLMGAKQQGSRILFNVIAIISFMPPLVLVIFQRAPLWGEELLSVRIAGAMILIGGAFIVWKSFQSFDSAAFIGMTKEGQAGGALLTGGLYNYVRHPMYFGTLLLFVGAFLWRQDLLMLVFSAISIAYLFIGSRNEEKKLVRQFPDEYPAYKSSTPAIIPSNWIGFFRKVIVGMD